MAFHRAPEAVLSQYLKAGAMPEHAEQRMLIHGQD